MSKSKNKFYVVWVGKKPGIYKTWKDAQGQIMGFPNAKYKAFKNLEEAKNAFNESPKDHIKSKVGKNKALKVSHLFNIEKNSISVDAACSGNPGIMEYRGVHTTTREELFHMGPFHDGTNNVGEFLALVQALAFLKKLDKPTIKIYSDSRTAMAWVRNKKVKTTLKKSPANERLFELMEKAIKWLMENEPKNEVLKWDTKNWGEIPADFGRK